MINWTKEVEKSDTDHIIDLMLRGFNH